MSGTLDGKKISLVVLGATTFAAFVFAKGDNKNAHLMLSALGLVVIALNDEDSAGGFLGGLMTGYGCVRAFLKK